MAGSAKKAATAKRRRDDSAGQPQIKEAFMKQMLLRLIGTAAVVVASLLVSQLALAPVSYTHLTLPTKRIV